MAQELTDEEVFGGAPTAAAGELGDFEVGIGRPAGYPSASAATPKNQASINFGTLLKDPGAALSMLGDRFTATGVDSLKHGSIGGLLGGLLGDALTTSGGTDIYGKTGQQRLEESRAAEKARRPEGPKSGLEFLTDLGSGLLYGMAAPESYATLPAKLAAPIAKAAEKVATRPGVQRAVTRAAEGAISNVALDPLIQAGNIVREQQDGYSPVQTAMAGATGLALSPSLGLAGDVIASQAVKAEAARAARETQRYADAVAKPWTVEDLWGGLEKQEGARGKMDVVSPKGAKGPGQLMPDTAQYVANKLGRPELAAAALSDDPNMAWANRLLGQTYLKEQLDAFDGDPALALAAYNAGPGKVREWVARFGKPDEVGRAKWVEMIPFGETRNYVKKILGDSVGAPVKLAEPELQARAQYMADQARTQEPAQPDVQAEMQKAATEQQAQAEKAVETAGQQQAATVEQAQQDLTARSQEIEQEIQQAAEGAAEPEGGQNAGPQDLNEAQPTEDFGDEFDRLSRRDPAPARERDVTDDALDIMRSGKAVQVGQGESLIGALVREGGVRDEGGELTNILGGAGDTQLLKRLRRVNTGMALDDATLWAWQRGYIGKPDGDRPHIQELLDAIGEEGAGRKRYAQNNEEARLVQERIESLDEMLGYLGMDPRTHSNDEIRAAMDDFMESANRFEDDGAYRYDEELEPGSLGMAPDRMALGGKGAKSPEARAREAGFRIRDMDDILGASKGAGPKYRDQLRLQAVPHQDGVVTPKLVSTRDISKRLLKKLGIVRRQGRIRMRNADGVYSKSTGVIRTKGIHELDVVAHEIGHALEFTKKYPTLLATMKAYEKSLRADDYEPGKGRRYEGFAEFFRRYMTNPEAAERVHPQFFHAFERAMATDAPDDLKVMKQAQADYREFMTAPSIEAMRTKMTNPQKMGIIDTIRKGVDEGPMEAVGDFMHEVYRGVFNSIHPWSRVVDKVQEAIERRDGVKLDLKAVDDPSKLLAAMPYVAMSGHTDLFGPRDYDDPTQITGSSLIDALTLALGGKGIFGTDMLKGWNWKKEDIEDFGLYLTGRRVLHLYDRFRDGKMDRPPDDTGIGDRSPAWEQTVADLELRNPQYREAADMVYDWTDAMLKKRVKAGFISPEAYMQLQIDHPEYVPLFRDMDGFGGSGGSSLAEAGKMKQLTGSDRNYINPIHSLVQMAYQQAAMVQQNDAVAALHRIVQQAPPELGWMAEPIPAKDITSVRVGVNEVLEKAEKLVGVTEADAAIIRNVLESMFHDDDTVSVFRARDTVARRGENLIPYWKDGEMVMLQLPEGPWGKHMIEALAGMSQEGRSLAMRLISIPKQIVTATVTTIPHFFATNTVRDQIAAGLMTPSYVPGLDMARGMKSELSQDEMAHLYSAMAGEVAGMTVAGERKARAERDMRALNPAFKRVKHFASLAAIARAVSVSETGTRQGIFQRHYNEYLKQGFTPKEAATEARFQAHDYMPFSRRGAWPFARFLASVIPFENVALQGADKGTRVLAPGVKNAMDWITQRKVPQTRQEIEAAKLSWKLWSGAMIFGVVGLGLEAFNSDDPWVEELGEYYKNSHWVIQLPGTDEIALFPKEQYVGAFSNAFEALFNGIKKQDPKAGERFVSSMLQVWAPPTDSPVWNLPLELAAGKDSFGTPIVPEGKKDGLKSEQKRDDTKGLAVEFTDFLREKTKRKDGTSLIDWSPAMVDHLGKGLGTSWWRELPNEKGQAPIEQVGSETTMARRFIKAPWRGAQSTKEFFDLAGDGGKWADLASTANTLVLAGRKDDVAKLLEAASPERRAYALASVFQEGREKQVHPMIRAEESVRVYRDLVKDLRGGTVLAELPDGKSVPVKMTPHQRRLAVDELSKLAVAEQRNALIMTGVKGWTGTKAAIPTEPIRRKIFNEIPELEYVLKYRARNVMPEAEGFVKWLGSRGGFEGPLNRELFNAQADEKQFGGSGAKERFLNQSIPVPAAPASR